MLALFYSFLEIYLDCHAVFFTLALSERYQLEYRLHPEASKMDCKFDY